MKGFLYNLACLQHQTQALLKSRMLKKLSRVLLPPPQSSLKRQRQAQGFPDLHLTLPSVPLFSLTPSLKSKLLYDLWEFRGKRILQRVCMCRQPADLQDLLNWRAKNVPCLLFRFPQGPLSLLPVPSSVWPVLLSRPEVGMRCWDYKWRNSVWDLITEQFCIFLF